MALSHSPRIVTDGLVFAVDAANSRSYSGTGTTWSDLSGNGNNGTLTNGPTYDSANSGSIVFDGVNDYWTASNSSSLNISGSNITIGVVYKSNGLSDAQHGDGLISKGSGANDGQYELLLVPSGTKNIAFFRCNTVGTYSPGSTTMDIGTIYFITGVLSNGYMRLYINGVQEGTGVQQSNSIVSREQGLSIAARYGGSFAALNGNIYSASIYNRALTAAEVKQNFNATRSRYGI